MYSLSFLGGAALERDGCPLVGRIVQRRRQALLALLASSNGHPVSRDKLIACLWPETGTALARHSLSDSVHVIRKALGEGAVLVEGDELRLNPEVVSCDVWRFDAALAAGNLECAVGLYAGPFLDGFFIGGDALGFESWAAQERERLARAYVGALEGLAKRANAVGDPQRAAEWWRRLCVEEPENSRAVLGLMAALAGAGDRAGALREADEHAEHLRSEYGAEPDPTVTALVRRLREAPDAWLSPAAVAKKDGHGPASPGDEPGALPGAILGPPRLPSTGKWWESGGGPSGRRWGSPTGRSEGTGRRQGRGSSWLSNRQPSPEASSRPLPPALRRPAPSWCSARAPN